MPVVDLNMNNFIADLNKEFNNQYDLGCLNLDKYYSGRTNFQLENFVLKEHDCPERQCLQLIMELKSIRDGLFIDSLEIKKLEIQSSRLLATDDEIDKIEAQKKLYMIASMRENMEFRSREIKNIADLLKKLPKVYSYEEIEAAEKGYWDKRLTRQAMEDAMSAATGINQGNIRSIIQADLELKNKFLYIQDGLLNNFRDKTIKGQNAETITYQYQ